MLCIYVSATNTVNPFMDTGFCSIHLIIEVWHSETAKMCWTTFEVIFQQSTKTILEV